MRWPATYPPFWPTRCATRCPTVPPTPHRADVDAAGKLALLVERGGTLVAAEHVGNASFLRAYLMAFWHHVLETRGGLTLLVFDDPQELMDPNNRHRLVATMGKLADAGASLLLATHDSRFALEMCAEMRRRIMRHLSVHGRNATLRCAMLAPSVEALDEKRRAFLGRRTPAVRPSRCRFARRIREEFDKPRAARCAVFLSRKP